MLYEVITRDSYACADENYKLNIRVITEYPWSNQFAYNMFLRPTEEELKEFKPEWIVINAPGFLANPKDVITSYSIHYTKLYDIEY